MIAVRAKAARLAANLSQQGLAERSGVPLRTLKRFERAGAASIEVVVRIALALRMENGFETLFAPPRFTSINEVLAAPVKRRRGMTTRFSPSRRFAWNWPRAARGVWWGVWRGGGAFVISRLRANPPSLSISD